MNKRTYKRPGRKLRVRHAPWGGASRDSERQLQQLEELRRNMELWR